MWGLAHTYTPCTRFAFRPVGSTRVPLVALRTRGNGAGPRWRGRAISGGAVGSPEGSCDSWRDPGGTRATPGGRGARSREGGRPDGRLGPRRAGRGHRLGGESTAMIPFVRQAARQPIHLDSKSRATIRDFSLERVFGATFRKQLPLCCRETIERGRRD